MRNLLGASVKMVIRDRQSIFWAFFFPLILLGVFRLFSPGTANTTNLLVSADIRTETGAALVQALQQVPFLNVEVRSGVSSAEANGILAQRKFNAALLGTAAPTGQPAAAGLITAMRLNRSGRNSAKRTAPKPPIDSPPITLLERSRRTRSNVSTCGMNSCRNASCIIIDG